MLRGSVLCKEAFQRHGGPNYPEFDPLCVWRPPANTLTRGVIGNVSLPQLVAFPDLFVSPNFFCVRQLRLVERIWKPPKCIQVVLVWKPDPQCQQGLHRWMNGSMSQSSGLPRNKINWSFFPWPWPTTTTFCQVGRLVRNYAKSHAMPAVPQEMAMEFEDDDESDDDSGLEELLK